MRLLAWLSRIVVTVKRLFAAITLPAVPFSIV
jgi:hypothetical protein